MVASLSLSIGVEQGLWDDGEDDGDESPALTFGASYSIPLRRQWSLNPGISGEYEPNGQILKLGFQVGISWNW